VNVTKIILNRCQIFHLKCTKFNFGWGCAPDPAGRAHRAPPDHLAGFGERKRTARERRGRRRRGGLRGGRKRGNGGEE